MDNPGSCSLPRGAYHGNRRKINLPNTPLAVKRNSERSRKRRRRTKAQIAQLENRIVEILREDNPQSVRHVFYRLVDDQTLDVPVPKTEAGYNQVGDRLRKLRWSGRVDWRWVSDATRRGHFVTTYTSPADFVARTLGMYRLDEWAHADHRVEVWCESRSLAGTVQRTCEELGVDLYPAGDFASDTFVYEAAQEIEYIGKPTVLLYLGDYDPAGLLIDQDIIRKLREHLPDQDVELRRLAITAEQIEQYNLPTKPRKAGDRRRLDIEDTVEAEALPAGTLREMLRDAVDEYLPDGVRERTRRAEAVQRETPPVLSSRVDKTGGGAWGS